MITLTMTCDDNDERFNVTTSRDDNEIKRERKRDMEFRTHELECLGYKTIALC